MAKKKVLHIGQSTGGVKTYVAYVFDYLHNCDYDFVMAGPADRIFEPFCKERNINYYEVDLHRGFNPIAILNSIIRLVRIIIIEKPDIIHTHSAKGGFLGRLAAILTGSKNVIYTPHAFSYLSFSGIKRVVFFSLEMIAKRWTDLLLAISYSEAAKAITELGFKKMNVNMILNSIQIPDNIPSFTSNPVIKIRMIGRLTVQKNHLLFLEIANELLKKYPAVEFSILGAGIHDDLTSEINDYLANNDLIGKIKIDHWGDPETSRDFIAKTDIFVMTSIFEGLSYSLLEAMALGKPCVVSDVEGNKDVIRNYENGFSCISKTEFCEKLELLINNRELSYRLGRAGYEYVKKHHNVVTSMVQLDRLYSDLIRSSSKVTYRNLKLAIPVHS